MHTYIRTYVRMSEQRNGTIFCTINVHSLSAYILTYVRTCTYVCVYMWVVPYVCTYIHSYIAVLHVVDTW